MACWSAASGSNAFGRGMGDCSCDSMAERSVSIRLPRETVKAFEAYAAQRATKANGTLTSRNTTIFSLWEEAMGEKLQQGDRFPSLTLKLVQGGTMRLPDEMPTRYVAVLFYRGHW